MALTLLAQYDDFSGGHWGSDQTAEMAPKDTFGGVNVMRYMNGLLGPRPPFRRVGVTSAPIGAFFGTVNPFDTNAGYPLPYFISGTSVFALNGGALTLVSPAIGQQPTSVCWFGELGFYHSQSGFSTIGRWSAGLAPETTAALPIAFGRDLIQYGPARMAYVSFNGRSVYFSGAGTPMVWPSGGSALFVGVGDDSQILRLVPFRDGALALKASGVFFISGDPQDGSLTVRRLASPPSTDGTAIRNTSRNLYTFEDGNAVGFADQELRGTRWRRLLGRRPLTTSINPLNSISYHAFPGQGAHISHHVRPLTGSTHTWNGWNRDSLGVWSYWTETATSASNGVTLAQQAGTQPVMPSQEMVAFRYETDNRLGAWAAAGDGVIEAQRSACTAQLPARFFDRYVRVREAVVVYRSVTPTSGFPVLNATVTAVGLADPSTFAANVSPVTSGVGSFQVIQGGVWQESRLRFGDGPAARGFFLSLNLSHAAIKSVQVYGTHEQDRVGP